jgi:nucleotide-binding universal stress UspA family protein
MKKFIVAFDGLDFSKSAMKYAIHFAKQCNAHLVGIFLEDFTLHSYGVKELVSYEGSDLDKHIADLNQGDQDRRRESIKIFEEACQDRGLTFSIHRDNNIALQDLLHESVYADLLIIAANETLTRFDEPLPSRFIKDLLSDVQCPVFLTPLNYKIAEKIILLYDGSPSSVHAARMFSYLFETAREKETEIITVKPKDASLHVPDNRLIKEFIKRHYPNARYVVLKGEPEEEIVKELKLEQENVIVVTGAYRRSRFSRFLRPSMADCLLSETRFPLFIAHNKS